VSPQSIRVRCAGRDEVGGRSGPLVLAPQMAKPPPHQNAPSWSDASVSTQGFVPAGGAPQPSPSSSTGCRPGRRPVGGSPDSAGCPRIIQNTSGITHLHAASPLSVPGRGATLDCTNGPWPVRKTVRRSRRPRWRTAFHATSGASFTTPPPVMYATIPAPSTLSPARPGQPQQAMSCQLSSLIW